MNKLLVKLKSWLNNMFHKSKDNVYIPEKIETSESVKKDIRPSFFDEQRQKSARRMYLLELQKRFENKDIVEEEINFEDMVDLENLYIEQVNELQRKIKAVDNKMKK